MRRSAFVRASAAAAILASVAAATAAGAGRDVVPTVSSNWSGYAVADATTVANGTTDPTQTPPVSYTSITATWRQPAVTCVAGQATYSAFWIGIGGFSSGASALEQTGTGADCTSAGRPSSYAWYELVPAAPVTMPITVAPGDLVTASVNIAGTDVLVQVKNRTRRTSFTKHLTMVAPDLTSAEWIAEAPSNCDRFDRCNVLPLANFGRVTFSRIATTGSSHPGTITDPAWSVSQLQLVPSDGARSFFSRSDTTSSAGANPAQIDPEGRTFSVAWTPSAGS
jgi:hypothetical protein